MKSIFLNHLKSGLLKAKGETAKIAEATVDALVEMDTEKADKPEAVSITLLASGWASGSGLERWPYYYDIVDESITEADTVNLWPLPASAGIAATCGLSAYQTSVGKLRLLSRLAPQADISAEYYIIKGKENV
ncbi:MAG TPA: hypothetical protein IAB47_07105 [Candidatus Scatomorpha merdigallinarum]|nr:hypothetical protein [Candidatus Scatomorpha merdigallinarum]